MATVWRSQCAFARLFAGKTQQILNNSADLSTKPAPESLSALLRSRNYSNYAHSPFVRKIKEQYEFDIVKKPSEWAYVQRLMPFQTIPEVTIKEGYPSGWIPPKEEAKNLLYFIPRTKNQEIPIYLNITFRGQRKISFVKKIEGDIWLMNEEIRDYLKNIYQKPIVTRVHELGRFIEVRGDYVTDLKDWAYSKGF